MPRKQWAAYEKVTAADVNANLSDQSVMRFASSTARSSAIPSPTEGMVSWLDDINALQVYDGTAWVAVIGGTPGNPLGAGDTLNMGFVGVSPGSVAANTWTEITTGLGSAVYIYAVQILSGSNGCLIDIGTGSAGSEVVRMVFGGEDDVNNGGVGISYAAAPWGMFVPASTRIAFRRRPLTGTAANTVTRIMLQYVTVAAGTQVQAGSVTFAYNGGSWKQVAATPPLAGGVWVTGVIGRATDGNLQAGLKLGLGAAGSEVDASGSFFGSQGSMWVANGNVSNVVHIQPVWWPPSTRLAFITATTATNFSPDAAVIWRESLV